MMTDRDYDLYVELRGQALEATTAQQLEAIRRRAARLSAARSASLAEILAHVEVQPFNRDD